MVANYPLEIKACTLPLSYEPQFNGEELWPLSCAQGAIGCPWSLEGNSLSFCLQVGEFRAHAAEWTANVSAEFKETRRRLSVDIYDKFQRAASIKRKLSSELGINASINQEMTPGKRTLSANLTEDRDVSTNMTLSLSPVTGALSRNGSLYLNGLSPDYADRREIAIIENLKWGAEWESEREIQGTVERNMW